MGIKTRRRVVLIEGGAKAPLFYFLTEEKMRQEENRYFLEIGDEIFNRNKAFSEVLKVTRLTKTMAIAHSSVSSYEVRFRIELNKSNFDTCFSASVVGEEVWSRASFVLKTPEEWARKQQTDKRVREVNELTILIREIRLWDLSEKSRSKLLEVLREISPKKENL